METPLKDLAVRSGLWLQRYFENTYSYVGHQFNGQRAVRCVFLVPRIGQLIEASNYEQRLHDIPIKVAIELSTMFGCPVGCTFCASGELSDINFLQVDELVGQGVAMADYYNQTVGPSVPKHFCFQGIGEPSLMPDRIVDAAHRLLGRYPLAKFKVSTMGANPTGIAKLAANVPWEAMQISFPHYDVRKLRELFRHIKNHDPLRVLAGVRAFCERRPDVRVKFNYIGIRDFNDTPEVIERTVKLLRSQGFLLGHKFDKSEFKISFLNPTDVGRMFNLRDIGQTGLEDLLGHVQIKLGVKSAYIFGPMQNCTVGCGQLIADYHAS